jgi:large subunit ribosomal protein L29
MKAKDLRNKTDADLATEVVSAQKAMFSLRMQRSAGDSVKSHEFKNARRLVARIKTISAEREREAK